MTKWRFRIACCVTKSTNTPNQFCVILTAFLLQQCLHERASLLRYTYIVCLVYIAVYIRVNYLLRGGADKSLARPGRKQATATEDFEFHISLKFFHQRMHTLLNI
jgi:hypothetical protein